jgi:hypothetical protein
MFSKYWMVWLMLKLEMRVEACFFVPSATVVSGSFQLVLSSIERITGPNSGVDAHRLVWSACVRADPTSACVSACVSVTALSQQGIASDHNAGAGKGVPFSKKYFLYMRA